MLCVCMCMCMLVDKVFSYVGFALDLFLSYFFVWSGLYIDTQPCNEAWLYVNARVTIR